MSANKEDSADTLARRGAARRGRRNFVEFRKTVIYSRRIPPRARFGEEHLFQYARSYTPRHVASRFLFLSFFPPLAYLLPFRLSELKQTCKFFGEPARHRWSRKQYVLILSDLFISCRAVSRFRRRVFHSNKSTLLVSLASANHRERLLN